MKKRKINEYADKKESFYDYSQRILEKNKTKSTVNDKMKSFEDLENDMYEWLNSNGAIIEKQ